MTTTCSFVGCGARLDPLSAHIAHDEGCGGNGGCYCETEVCAEHCPDCNPAIDITGEVPKVS